MTDVSLPLLTADERQELATWLKKKQISKGNALFRPGERADCVYFLEKGRLAVQTGTGFEDREQVVALLEVGAVVGERALAIGGLRGMTVMVLEDADLFVLSTEAFAKLEKTSPRLAIRLLKILLGTAVLRLQAGSQRLAHVL